MKDSRKGSKSILCEEMGEHNLKYDKVKLCRDGDDEVVVSCC